MLGNKDFAQMVSSGAVGGGSDGKVRFDLKQISKWDRENNKVVKKKVDNPFKTKEKEKSDGNAFGYRDRALERRKDLNTEESKFEEMVSKLDAEQTKFLGGDLEHTHLVRGLDYALLEKIRSETSKELQKLQAATDSEMVVKPTAAVSIPGITEKVYNHPSEIEVTTQLGNKLKKMLFPAPESNKSAPVAPALYESIGVTKASTVKKAVASSTAQVLARTFYQFSLQHSDAASSAEKVDEIPVTLTKSAKEVDNAEDQMTYSIETALLDRIAALYDNGKMVSQAQYQMKRKRREKEAEIQALKLAAAAPSKPVQKLASDFDSIYDDDVPMSKYVPVGALEEGEVASALLSGGGEGSGGSTAMDVSNELSAIYGDAAVTSSFANSSSAGSASAKGIFSSSFRPSVSTSGVHTSSTAAAAISTATSSAVADSEELMKPVRELLQAQAKKERAQQLRVQQEQANAAAALVGKQIVVGVDAQGKELVHRDVFATTADRVVKGSLSTLQQGKGGDVFGTSGSYDLYPETAEYEVFSDDDEGEDEGKPANKKAHTAGSHNDSTYDDTESSAAGPGRGFSTAGMEGSIKKSLLKTASTPWSRGHGASESNTGGGGSTGFRPNKQAPSGQNRAARRAGGGDK